ncbi:hypothetical protein PG988_006717 [Apiospora saccharicola]
MEFTSQSIAAGATPVTTANGLQYKPRTADEREADAKKNAPKYARQKIVNSILTAKYLKAKAAFDGFYSYDLDAAFNAEDGTWDEAKDPWLRIKETLPEFLEGYTQKRFDTGLDIAGDELDVLATAIIRLAKKELEGAGRDPKVVDDAFTKEVKAVVQKVTAQHNLAPSRQQEEDEEEEEVEEEE